MDVESPASSTWRGSRTPGSRPITLKTQSVATVGELAALEPRFCPWHADCFSPRGAALALRHPSRLGLGLGAELGASSRPTEGPGEDALITRPDCDVRVRVLPPLAYDFALQLRDGATLIEAAAAMNDPGFDFGTHLVGLVESGAVASIIPGQTS